MMPSSSRPSEKCCGARELSEEAAPVLGERSFSFSDWLQDRLGSSNFLSTVLDSTWVALACDESLGGGEVVQERSVDSAEQHPAEGHHQHPESRTLQPPPATPSPNLLDRPRRARRLFASHSPADQDIASDCFPALLPVGLDPASTTSSGPDRKRQRLASFNRQASRGPGPPPPPPPVLHGPDSCSAEGSGGADVHLRCTDDGGGGGTGASWFERGEADLDLRCEEGDEEKKEEAQVFATLESDDEFPCAERAYAWLDSASKPSPGVLPAQEVDLRCDEGDSHAVPDANDHQQECGNRFHQREARAWSDSPGEVDLRCDEAEEAAAPSGLATLEPNDNGWDLTCDEPGESGDAREQGSCAFLGSYPSSPAVAPPPARTTRARRSLDLSAVPMRKGEHTDAPTPIPTPTQAPAPPSSVASPFRPMAPRHRSRPSSPTPRTWKENSPSLPASPVPRRCRSVGPRISEHDGLLKDLLTRCEHSAAGRVAKASLN